MTKFRLSPFAACWLALILAAWPVLRAQETPPAAPPPPDQPAAPAEPAPPAGPAAEKSSEAAPTDEKVAEKKEAAGELRDITPDDHSSTSDRKSTRRRGRHDGPRVGDQTVSAGSTQDAMVTINGDVTVDGHVTDAAVSVLGNTTVNGTVDDAAVSVLGTTTVNGHVKGEAIAVLGDVVLGPQARVDGEIVAVLGKVIRSPGAETHGTVQQIANFTPFRDAEGLRVWVAKCFFMARPLAFDARLLWAWWIALGFLAFYAFIALITPAGVQKCVSTFEERPGYSLLAALLTMLLTPIAYILLALTAMIVIGAVLIPVFTLGLFFAAIFGKIVILAWLGRRLTRLAGDSPLTHPFFGVLIGGVILLLCYTIPIAGFIIYKVSGILGLGIVVYTLILQFKASRPPKPAPVVKPMPVVPPVMPVAAAPGAANIADPASFAGMATMATAVPPPPPPMLPPVISAATLPRVGFWHRIAASLLDAVLVGVMCGFLSNMWHGFEIFPFWYALYCVVMWATKGTTIGGIICSLKVVRVDDRPIEWSVAIVRGLGGFLSLFVAGLGFIWVAFDDEKQSWHDKIAGTTIVRVPKGTSLL